MKRAVRVSLEHLIADGESFLSLALAARYLKRESEKVESRCACRSCANSKAAPAIFFTIKRENGVFTSRGVRDRSYGKRLGDSREGSYIRLRMYHSG
jgi:hypothetical protein